nr:ABC-type transport auxiliary lipoprotein family protein [Burkholderia guangdongensis]
MFRLPGRARRPAIIALGAPALTLALAFVLAFVLAFAAGCAGPGVVAHNARYDLGPAVSASSPGGGPALRVLDVDAPAALDSDKFTYRLAYADAQRTAAYRDSRWAAPPAQLLTQRLRGALSSRGAVLDGADGVSAPTLRVDLDAFEQVFDGQTESRGVVAARATLTQAGKVLGQRTFTASAPARSPDAAGGARSLAAASDALVEQIAAWADARIAESAHAQAGAPAH